MKPSRLLTALAAAFLLSGCLATMKDFRAENMPNGLFMNTACDDLKMDSMWFGLFGITSQIREKDAKPVLNALCGGAKAAAPAGAASGAK